MKNLDGKVTLITGGARGLGEAVCRELSAAGATVILADIRMDLAKKVADDLNSQNASAKDGAMGNGSVTPIELNVMDEKQIQMALEKVKQDFGRLDVLVNSAGMDKTASEAGRDYRRPVRRCPPAGAHFARAPWQDVSAWRRQPVSRRPFSSRPPTGPPPPAPLAA